MDEADSGYIIALDQGTTSSRAILYHTSGVEIMRHSARLPVDFPHDGWVEQDPQAIWETQKEALDEVASGVPAEEIRAIGITNQRETTVAWDPETGEGLTPAIVWQCRRSADICDRFRKDGLEDKIHDKTGLVVDPYFSATKIVWMLENVDGLRERAEKGKVVFGTVDSWVLYNLTKSKTPVIATEPSNASRTMLVSLETGDWDQELLDIFSIPAKCLPKIMPSNANFGLAELRGKEVPVTGILGDQQASLLGHGCLSSDAAKCTFGTGAFLLVNVGSKIQRSDTGLLSTIAWGLQGKGNEIDLNYAVEGSVFVAGSVVTWLQDKLRVIMTPEDSEFKAGMVEDSGGVVLVPAFVGLGAPHWDDSARGAILGLTRDSSSDHVVRAALDSVAHQVADIIEGETFSSLKTLRIDGGMSKNTLFRRLLSDITQLPIEIPPQAELTAFGAAIIASVGAGIFPSLQEASDKFKGLDDFGREITTISPEAPTEKIATERARWKKAVERAKHWAED